MTHSKLFQVAAESSAEELRALSCTFMMGVCVGELLNLGTPEEEVRAAFERAIGQYYSNSPAKHEAT